jgi:hypothetical protein
MKDRAPTTQPAHNGLVIHMTSDELEDRLEAAVARAMAAQAPKSDYLSRSGLARELDVSVATIARMMVQGCPYVRVGDSPRFRIADVQSWLEERGKGPDR